MHPQVIYQDDDLLVLNKPAGMVVDRSVTQQSGTLEEILADEFGITVERSGIVHRLDKDTSGIILVAKTEEAKQNLQIQFQQRQVEKEYLALVHGLLDEKKVVDVSMGRNPHDREKFVVFDSSFVGIEGKDSLTEFEPMQKLSFSEKAISQIFADFNKIQMRKLSALGYNQFTLVKCLPRTGRTHQIRVHLKYIGLPIVADSKYTGRKICRMDRRWCKRMFLHAKLIKFAHPVTGDQMEFVAELPKDLLMALDSFKQ